MALQVMSKAWSWAKVVFPLTFASSIVVCASHSRDLATCYP
ncbi:hypothetical protein EV131_105312 [Rhizobium laguerreae]|uniref:Uncharacterized protein n=1 Tax=Rhizobium laguerreae TaxID=1076926 RepID=A0AAX2QLF4_9HYPH|nr:hypothetical protein EV131_105312 [Rhizobium laguerreae]